MSDDICTAPPIYLFAIRWRDKSDPTRTGVFWADNVPGKPWTDQVAVSCAASSFHDLHTEILIWQLTPDSRR